MRMSGFATLRKKLIKRRRYSKVCNHGRVIRELISDWSPAEVTALLEEYEALAALKDLSVQAELARPPAATFKQDLSTLYDHKYCTDVDRSFVFRTNFSVITFILLVIAKMGTGDEEYDYLFKGNVHIRDLLKYINLMFLCQIVL